MMHEVIKTPYQLIMEDLQQIATKHQLTLTIVKQKHGNGGRKAIILAARREMCLHLRNRGWSYPRIGKFFERDHSTIMHYVKGKRQCNV